MYSLAIFTSEKKIFINSVRSMVLPGVMGYLEILSHHAPIIALLQPGKLEISIKNAKKDIYAISNGFIEFSNNKAALFVDSIELTSTESFQDTP